MSNHRLTCRRCVSHANFVSIRLFAGSRHSIWMPLLVAGVQNLDVAHCEGAQHGTPEDAASVAGSPSALMEYVLLVSLIAVTHLLAVRTYGIFVTTLFGSVTANGR